MTDFAGDLGFRKSAQPLFLGNLFGQVLTAVTFTVVARLIGPGTLGTLAALLGVAAVAQDLLDFGTSAWVIRELAAGRLRTDSATAWLRRRTVAVALVLSVATAAALLTRFHAVLVAATAAYIGSAVVNAGAHALLRARAAYHRSAIHLTGERLLWLALSLGVISSSETGTSAAGLLIVAMAASYLISALAAGEWWWPRSSGARPGLAATYKEARYLGLMGASTDLQQLDAALTVALASSLQASYVGVASKLTSPLGLVSSTVSQVMFRDVAFDSGRGRALRLGPGIKVAAGLAVIIVAVTPFLPWLTVLVLGSQYHQARGAVVAYAVGTAIAVINQPLASVLLAHGKSGQRIAQIVALAIVSGLGVGALLVRHIGAVGMGIGFLGAQIVILASELTLLRSMGVWRRGAEDGGQR